MSDTSLQHYEWVGGMWCRNKHTVVGNFDDEINKINCSACGESYE